MRYKLTLILILIGTSIFLVKPLTADAFWWFKSAKTTATDSSKASASENSSLDDQAKKSAEAKYKIWASSFEQANIDLVVANKNNFIFSVPELNYIFATETKKAKSPIITNFQLTSSQDNLNIAGDFHKIISGRFSFIARVVNIDKKARLELSYVRLYGLPIPANWLADPLNQAIDEYFSFLYHDSRYQGFNFLNQNNNLQFKPEFKL